MAKTSPPPAPRPWFAFRLSTLVLLVWTLPTAWLLFDRWAPWHLETTLGWCPLSSIDGRKLLLKSGETITIYDVDSRREEMFPFIKDTDSVALLQGDRAVIRNGDNLQVWELSTRRQLGSCAVSAFRRAHLHEKILIAVGRKGWSAFELRSDGGALQQICGGDDIWPEISMSGRYLIARNVAWDLPAAKTVAVPGVFKKFLYPSDLVLAALPGETGVTVYNLTESKIVCGLEAVEYSEGSYYWSDGEYIHRNTGGENDVNTERWSLTTGKLVSNAPQRRIQYHGLTPDKTRYFDEFAIWDFKTGARLCELPRPGLAPVTNDCCVAREHDPISTSIWRRRHPEWWWGHFYRPEVWAGLVLGCLWLWKLKRALTHKAAA